MQYMLLIYSDPSARPAYGSPEMQAEFGSWLAYSEDLRAAGAFIAGDPLEPIATATTVRKRDGETLLVDGPFAETKETLGGYYLIEVADLDAAVEWASRMPNITYGSVEVRPLMAMPARA